MALIINLNKAVNIPNVSTNTVDDRRAKRSYDESFSRQQQGVSGGDSSPDHPDKGGKWGHGDSLDETLENDRKRDSQISKERGLISKDEDEKEETKKSEAIDILKSFSKNLESVIRSNVPNEREIEYLTIVKGYSMEEVADGTARIYPNDRSKFNSWLQSRLQKSISKLR